MLTACPECGLQVSNKVISCPHCGVTRLKERIVLKRPENRLKDAAYLIDSAKFMKLKDEIKENLSAL